MVLHGYIYLHVGSLRGRLSEKLRVNWSRDNDMMGGPCTPPLDCLTLSANASTLILTMKHAVVVRVFVNEKMSKKIYNLIYTEHYR